jgi:hypothetical protein
VKNRRQGAPQAALDGLRGAQTAEYTSSKIEIDQRPGRDPRGGCRSGFVLFGNQIAAATRGAGQFVGTLARLLKADVARAPERQTAHLPRPSYAVRQVPRLHAARRDPHRQPLAALIGDPIRGFRRPQSLD